MPPRSRKPLLLYLVVLLGGGLAVALWSRGSAPRFIPAPVVVRGVDSGKPWFVSGVVLDLNGKPAPDASLWVFDLDVNPFPSPCPIVEVEPPGLFDLDCAEGAEFANDEFARGNLQAAPLARLTIDRGGGFALTVRGKGVVLVAMTEKQESTVTRTPEQAGDVVLRVLPNAMVTFTPAFDDLSVGEAHFFSELPFHRLASAPFKAGVKVTVGLPSLDRYGVLLTDGKGKSHLATLRPGDNGQVPLPQRFGIAGAVLDGTRRLAGVQIELEDSGAGRPMRATTDGQGGFEFPAVLCRHCRLTATLGGARREYQVDTGTDAATGLNLQLFVPGKLQLRLFDAATRQPLRGRVEATSGGEELPMHEDGPGLYSALLPLTAKAIHVAATADDHLPGSLEITLDDPRKDLRRDLSLPLWQALSGTVTTDRGVKLEHEKVLLVEPRLGKLIASSDSSGGLFLLTGIPDGRFRLQVVDRVTLPEQVLVDFPTTQEVHLTVSTGPGAPIRVLDSQGRHVGGARVELRAEGGGPVQETLATSARGEAVLYPDRQRCEVRIRAPCCGEVPWTALQRPSTPARNQVLRFPPPIEIHGTLVDQDGAPVGKGWVTCSELDASRKSARELARARTDAGGRFALRSIPAESLFLRASMDQKIWTPSTYLPADRAAPVLLTIEVPRKR